MVLGVIKVAAMKRMLRKISLENRTYSAFENGQENKKIIDEVKN